MEPKGLMVAVLLKLLSHFNSRASPIRQLHSTEYSHVKTNIGDITGIVKMITFDGNHYFVAKFLGIPYAEPPVGSRRFQKPVPKEPFKSPYNAFGYGPSCLQKPIAGLQLSEDCLYLNIFVPQVNEAPFTSLPVMVWIHGGSFVAGTSTMYQGDTLCAFGQVIVVTINYRLGYFGFLWTDEEFGNFGLWDQHTAFKWIYENIAAFGGDTNRITIFGESAGGTSVVYQTLYSGNKNLFQRAIAQSGSTSGPWAFAPKYAAEANFAKFASDTRCPGNHSETLRCLRKKTSDEMAKLFEKTIAYSYPLVPNKDNHFATHHPRHRLLSSGKDPPTSLDFFNSIDIIVGGNSIDGTVYLPKLAHIENLEDLIVTRHGFETYFIPMILSSIFNDVENIPQSMIDATVFEYTNWTDPDNLYFRKLELVELLTDAAFFAPMLATVYLHSKGSKTQTYLYQFSASPRSHVQTVPSWLDGPGQATHADELLYLFGFSEEMVTLFQSWTDMFEYSAQDIFVSKAVMTMWTNFAKTG